MIKKKILLAVMFLSVTALLFAGKKIVYDQEYLLEVLPPQTLEKRGIRVEVQPVYHQNSFIFKVKLENLSFKKYALNLGKKSFFNGHHPSVLNSRSEEILLLPNETIERSLIFDRQKLADDTEYTLKLADFLFYVKYRRISKLLQLLDRKKTTVFTYLPKNNLKVESFSGKTEIVLQNNSRKNIYKAFFYNVRNIEFRIIFHKIQ